MSKITADAKEVIKLFNSSIADYNHIKSSDAIQELQAHYFFFKENVRSGKCGKTAQFWLQYIDRVWLLLKFLRATKSNDLNLHRECLEQLCPLLFSMNHHNYARYLAFYCASLKNISHTHPKAEALLRKGGFSVNRSSTSNCRTPVDLTIEQTINRHAKTKGGIVGFSQNRPAYYRWCVTRHSRASYVSATQSMAGLSDEISDGHKEHQPAQKKNSEMLVQKTLLSLTGFTDPFDVDCDDLLCLSSGLQVPEETANQLLSLEDDGKQAYEEFVECRLQENTVPFHAPIRKKNVCTFSSVTQQVNVTSSKTKTTRITAQRDMFGQLLLLSHTHHIDLSKVMCYPLHQVPWSLATSDGSLMKTNKATLLHKLEGQEMQDVPSMPNMNDVHIVDGNALLQSLKVLPNTFGELALKVFTCLPKAQVVHFVTDSYDIGSIKAVERTRRGTSSLNSYIVQGPSTKLPRNWKTFLANDSNKTSLINLLLQEWAHDSYAHRLKGRQIFFVNRDQCYLLGSEDGSVSDSSPAQDLFSSQEEADTKIILHSLYASKQPGCDKLVIRSPDTDVFLLLLAFIDQINKPVIFDTGTGNNRRQLNMTMIAEKSSLKLRQALLGLHSFTGCDSTSSFAGKGKLRPLSLMQKHENMMDVFAELGMQEKIDESVLMSLEKFVCLLYGHSTETDINRLRYQIVRQRLTPGNDSLLSHRRGIDLTQVPPCHKTLVKHIRRSNYQAMIWRKAWQAYPELPKPEDNGWKQTELGTLSIDWCEGEIFPEEIVDILADKESDTQEPEDDDPDSDGQMLEWSSESETSDSEDEMCYTRTVSEVLM